MRGAWCALLLAGCATIVPMQTASVVERGRVRVGGQVSASMYCGAIGEGALGISSCNDFPDGVPIPELRANARVGLGQSFDLGVSLQGHGMVLSVERAFQLGLTVDLKGELLHLTTSGPTHILSVGLLGGAAFAGRFGLPLWPQVEWAVPIFYGLQFTQWELVLSANASHRFSFSPNVTPSLDSVRTGFSIGLFHREPAGFAVQVGYSTDPASFRYGSFQLQVGLFFDR